MMLLKKEDREEEEYYFAPTKTKASKSKHKGKADGGSSKPIKHNAETFQLFDKLKLDAPITVDDIPPLLEKLEEQLAVYKKKVEEWQVNRDEMKRKILEGNTAEEAEENDKAEEDKEWNVVDKADAVVEEEKPAEETEE